MNGETTVTEEAVNAVQSADFDPPDSPVPRPDIQSDAPKKRGRKPLPRDAAGNIIHPDGTVGSKPRTAVARVAAPVITDDEAGKAIQGAFMLASVPLGPHWRLFPQEQTELGKCFGPLFRRYPDKVGDYLTALMIAPTAVAVVMPRLVVSKMRAAGDIEKGQERITVLRIVSMLEAEKHLNIAREVRESEDFLRATVAGAAVANAEASKKEEP